MKDKLKAMWEILRGRSVIYGVSLKAAPTGTEGALAVQGGPWVAAAAVRGNGVFIAGRSQIG